MKFIASVAAVAMARASACDLICAAIYSVDPVACDCVPIEWMECHPQYRLDCNQRTYDIEHGRDPRDNPYQMEEPECDLICLAIYSVDPVACQCVPIEWMECHP